MSETKKTTKETEDKKEKKEKKAPAKKKSTVSKTKTDPKLVRGIVADCARLNVRSLATMTSGVVAILTRGDLVTVDQKNSEEGWYAITTKSGKKGYCMKKYIKIP